jgi:hypothetical protein
MPLSGFAYISLTQALNYENSLYLKFQQVFARPNTNFATSVELPKLF